MFLLVWSGTVIFLFAFFVTALIKGVQRLVNGPPQTLEELCASMRADRLMREAHERDHPGMPLPLERAPMSRLSR